MVRLQQSVTQDALIMEQVQGRTCSKQRANIYEASWRTKVKEGISEGREGGSKGSRYMNIDSEKMGRV